MTRTVDYEWTLGDRLRSITYPSGAVVSFQHDAAGRVVQVRRSESGRKDEIAGAVTYKPFGPLFSAALMGPATLEIAYDANYAPDTLGGSALALDFDVDTRGNLTGAHAAGAPRAFHYDALSRLTQMTEQGVVLEDFDYDATGNRMSKQRSGVQETYGYPPASHRLTNIDTRILAYDAAGSLTDRGDGYTFEYNDAHRLSAVHQNGVVTMYAGYNARGERVVKSQPSPPMGVKPIYFVYDEAGHLLAEYASNQVGPITLLREYVWLDDRPVAVVVKDGSYAGQILAIHTDHLGTPRAITSETGTTVWTWPLGGSAFGEHAPNEDPDQDQVVFSFNLRYPGQYFDSESGLHYNYFRDYEPVTGRYVESDPLGIFGDIATYAYAKNRPLRYIDPDGRKAVQKCSGGNGRVVCDGKGGFKAEVCSTNRCTRDCTWAHELQHVQDLQVFAPNRCRDKPEGSSPYQIYDDYSGLEDKIECRGSAASIRCAADKLNDVKACADPACKSDLQVYMNWHIEIRRRRKCDSLGF